MAEEGQNRLAKALEALKNVQASGPCFAIHGSMVLGETNTRVLLENGFLENVLRGWYIPTTPGHAGTTISWYACFWGFVADYCHARFGKDWVLTPEESLLVWAGNGVIPRQVVVQVRKGSNSVQALKHDTSIFNFTTRLPKNIARDPAYGLNIYPLASALLRSSPEFFAGHSDVARSCLSALHVDDELKSALVELGGETYANRLAGAAEAIGRMDVVQFIQFCQKSVGRMVSPVNPFQRIYEPVRLFVASPIAARTRLMWQTMREQVLSVVSSRGQPSVRSLDEVLAEMDEGYVFDSYHSLSIEGYRVTEELIRRVKDGKWNPEQNTDDESQRNALAASGYYRAYRKVRHAVERIFNGESVGGVIATELADWHRELFMPCVDAGLLKNEDLLGYRRTQVVIAGSRYTPPAASNVTDAMEAFLDLLKNEGDPFVRAILGHFFLVHIHPFADGNGRTARFVMNASFASAGLPWRVISVESRRDYMSSLECASTSGDISNFARFVCQV